MSRVGLRPPRPRFARTAGVDHQRADLGPSCRETDQGDSGGIAIGFIVINWDSELSTLSAGWERPVIGVRRAPPHCTALPEGAAGRMARLVAGLLARPLVVRHGLSTDRDAATRGAQHRGGQGNCGGQGGQHGPGFRH